MKKQLFTLSYRLYQHCERRVNLDEKYISYKKRAVYAIIWGYTRAAIYLMS